MHERLRWPQTESRLTTGAPIAPQTPRQDSGSPCDLPAKRLPASSSERASPPVPKSHRIPRDIQGDDSLSLTTNFDRSPPLLHFCRSSGSLPRKLSKSAAFVCVARYTGEVRSWIDFLCKRDPASQWPRGIFRCSRPGQARSHQSRMSRAACRTKWTAANPPWESVTSMKSGYATAHVKTFACSHRKPHHGVEVRKPEHIGR